MPTTAVLEYLVQTMKNEGRQRLPEIQKASYCHQVLHPSQSIDQYRCLSRYFDPAQFKLSGKNRAVYARELSSARISLIAIAGIHLSSGIRAMGFIRGSIAYHVLSKSPT